MPDKNQKWQFAIKKFFFYILFGLVLSATSLFAVAGTVFGSSAVLIGAIVITVIDCGNLTDGPPPPVFTKRVWWIFAITTVLVVLANVVYYKLI